MGDSSSKLWIISLDARQGYHQVKVREEDTEKLAFFAPNDRKYCFTVMPFEPTNAPPFYTAMMKDFKDEWDALFFQMVTAKEKLTSGKVFPQISQKKSSSINTN